MTRRSKIKFKNIFISSTGGLLEMYDFSIYAFFAPILSQLFFPQSAGGFVALLSIFAIFSAGYLSRPIGAAFFGHFGDRVGRKSTLLWTIVIMGLSTTLMSLLPTWHQMGILAPILLLLLRILQGLAVGGDLPGAITFVAEHARREHRGIDCAWIFLGVNVGLLLAMASTGLVSTLLTHQQLMLWGWRIVFLSGMVIGVVAFYLRFRIEEPPLFLDKQKERALVIEPLKVIWQMHKTVMMQAISVMAICAIVVGHLLYLPTYFQVVLGLSFRESVFINTILILLFSLMIPFFGYLTDRIGRRKVLFFSTIGFLIFSDPIYYGFQMKVGYGFDISILLLAIFSAACIGVFPSMLAELFPTEVRYSGLAIGYNISFAVFCGTTPIIMIALFHVFSNPVAPSFYLMLGAGISLFANLSVKESKGIDLRCTE